MSGVDFVVNLPGIYGFMMRKYLIGTLAAAVALLSGFSASAQNAGYDVFNPIAKYIERGDAERLSAWFSENLEITIFSDSNDSSRNQARQIIKSFFRSYTPRTFEITHKAGRSNMKYALGNLNAGGEMFLVTIFVGYEKNTYRIQHFKIERLDY